MASPNTFIFWLDRPFDPRPTAKPRRRKGRYVTIRYRGSFGRSAVKALIILVFLAAMASAIGDRGSQDLSAKEVSAAAADVRAHR
ncbi:MAG TPA: hypothetical protein ENO03_01090 [Candidatus Aminicenantes bacterium]|nr:hypothetical protein [Candidatus Aminicenantes bacterium]